uniref:(northern house mosquito) hypothetical protein n=1 Tax=Culex pipiens TaxID=7175 RepID=A0A8D8CYD7_CULPI
MNTLIEGKQIMMSQTSGIKVIQPTKILNPTKVQKAFLMKKTAKAMVTQGMAMSLTRVPIVTPNPIPVLNPPKVRQAQKMRKRNISKNLKPKVQSRNLKTNNPPKLITILIQFRRNRPKLTKMECLN